MLILFFKRIKRRASKIYHNFKMTHGYIHVVHEGSNYSAPPMGMSNRLTVVLQQELH